MKIKVCGMKDPENIKELAKLPIDYMGLIFYSQSPRYVGNPDPQTLNSLPEHIKKVGVFVNKEPGYLLQQIDKYKLDYIQLHGNESTEYIKEIKEGNSKISIIEAFQISEISDFDEIQKYEKVCDYVLFDTKTPKYGGSGQKFDWKILDYYPGETPFFLSGGISSKDVKEIKKIQNPKLYGLDLNSRFETEPGIKNIQLIKEFIKRIKNEPN